MCLWLVSIQETTLHRKQGKFPGRAVPSRHKENILSINIYGVNKELYIYYYKYSCGRIYGIMTVRPSRQCAVTWRRPRHRRPAFSAHHTPAPARRTSFLLTWWCGSTCSPWTPADFFLTPRLQAHLSLGRTEINFLTQSRGTRVPRVTSTNQNSVIQKTYLTQRQDIPSANAQTLDAKPTRVPLTPNKTRWGLSPSGILYFLFLVPYSLWYKSFLPSAPYCASLKDLSASSSVR